MKGSKNWYWPAITTVEEANHTVKSSVLGFYIICLLLASIGYFLSGPEALVEATLVAFISFLVQRTKSFFLALLIFAWSLLAAYSTFANKIANSQGGGQNVVLSVIVCLTAVSAVRATWFLRKQDDPEKKSKAA